MLQLASKLTWWTLLILAVCEFALPAAAQTTAKKHGVVATGEQTPPAGPTRDENLQFRRVLVPADRPELWPTGGRRYLPIERREFERLLTDVAEYRAKGTSTLSVRIASAEHRALWRADHLLVGRSTIDIELAADRPALLNLSPWAAAVTSAHWVETTVAAMDDRTGDTSDEEASTRPIVLGNRPDGGLAVLVERSGRLIVDWQLRGHRGLNGSVNFPLQLPRTASTQWRLEAPSEYRLAADHMKIKPLNDGESDSKFSTWQLLAGGREPGTLRLLEREGERQRRELSLLRQTDIVRVAPRGIDVLTRLRIDVHGEPLTNLLLDIGPQLEVVAARQGAAELEWSWLPSEERSPRRIRVDLPKPLAGGSHVIEIEGVAPPAIGQLHKLPQIICNSALWQEGGMELTVDPMLELRLLNVEHARQARLADAPPDRAEPIGIQYFSQRAGVELIAGYPPIRLAIRTSETIQFSPSELSAGAIYELSCQQGEQSLLVANVGSRWQIDSVEAEDARLVGDWDVEGAEPNRRLTVRLARAVRNDHPVRITILGRRSYGSGDPLSLADLSILDLPRTENIHRRLWLEEPEGLDWQISGDDEVARLNPKQLPTEDPLRARATKSGGWGFAVDDQAESVRVATSPRRPRFSAAMRCEATVGIDTITEVLRVECRPSGTAMDRLLVQLSRPSADELVSWKGDRGLGAVSARRLSADEQLSAVGSGVGQAWEVTWRTPSREPFEIAAKVERATAGLTPITLAAAPEAVEQLGEVQVRVVENQWSRIENRRLQSLPARPLAAAEVPSSAGSFRYDPQRDGLMETPALLVKPEPRDSTTRGAWAWQAFLDTRLSNRDEAAHVAVFKIQTAGQTEIELSLPNGAELLTVWINDLRHLGHHRHRQKILLELPPDRAMATISVCFRTRQMLPRLATAVAPEFPRLSIPVLSNRWRLWVPQDYEIGTESPLAHRYSFTPLTWSQRLLGPIGRPLDGPSRNPLSSEFWRVRRNTPTDGDTSMENGRRVVVRLGQLVRESDPACANWGGLLTRLAEAVPDVELRVAQAMLIESGISPKSPVNTAPRSTALQAGNQVLRSANLTLLVRDRRVLVAPAVLAAMARDELRVAGDAEVAAITGGKLADDLSSAGELGAAANGLSNELSTRKDTFESAMRSHGFVTVSAWLKSITSPSPWNLPDVVGAGLSENSGWRCAEFYAPNSGTIPQASVSNRQQLRLAALILCGAIALLGITARCASTNSWLALVALATALALLAPLQWSILATCVFLSATFSALWFACRWPTRKLFSADATPQTAADDIRAALPTATIAGSLALGFALAVTNVQAEISPDSIHELPAVLVPIDADREPVGTALQLPESFYRQLLAQSAQARAVPSEWLIAEARYRVNLAADNIATGGTQLELRASWKLHVFSGTTKVQIPLFGEGLEIDRASVRLDGRPVDVTMTDDGLTVAVEPALAQRLELTVRVPRQFLGSLSSLELHVPPVADARIELIHGDPSPLESFETWGDITRDPTRDMTVANLGGVSRLMVRWRGNGITDGAAPNFEVDELLWAKVRPGALVVDVRVVVRVLSGKVRRLRLATDPELQLVTADANGVALTALPIANGELQKFELELAQAATDRTTIDLRFVMPDTSGIGNLRFPRCKLLDVTASRRYWGISVDPALDFREELEEQFRPLAIPDFAAAWGEGDKLPDVAFREFPGERALSITTRPKTVQLVATDKVVATARRNDAKIRWSAEIAKSSSSVFQWQMHVPVDVQVAGISIAAPDAAAPRITWMHDRENALVTVRSLTPIAAEHQITLWGSLATVPGQVWKIPIISLTNATLTSRELFVAREADVQVNCEATDGWQVALDATGELTLPPQVRLVSAWNGAESTAKPIRVRTELNSPEVRGTLLTIVNADGERWSADVELQVRVDQGVVDAIELRADRSWQPVDWLDPTSITPAELQDNFESESVDRTIRIRLREPTSGALQWTLHGDIEAGERSKLPVVRPSPAHAIDQYVLLPRHRDVSALAWRTTGLEPIANADFPRLGAAFVESHDLYRVVRPQPRAWPGIVEISNAQRRVELVEHWFACHGHQPFGGISTFYLAPTELGSIEFHMPAEISPVHCRCGNTPIELTQNKSGLWVCPLPVKNVPQAITLIYRRNTTGTSNANQTRTVLPSIEQAEVGQSLYWAAGLNRNRSQSQEPITAPIDIERYLKIRSTAIKIWRASVGFSTDEPQSATPKKRIEAAGATGQSGTTNVGPFASTSVTGGNVHRMSLAERYDSTEPFWILVASDSPILTTKNGSAKSIETMGGGPRRNTTWPRWILVGVVFVGVAVVLVHQGPRSQIGKISAEALLLTVAAIGVLGSASPLAGAALGAVVVGWQIWRTYRNQREAIANR